MNLRIVIYCLDCSKKFKRLTFDGLTPAVQHIIQYGHEIQLEIEDALEDEDGESNESQ